MTFSEGSARLSKDDIIREFEQSISQKAKNDVGPVLRQGSPKRVQRLISKGMLGPSKRKKVLEVYVPPKRARTGFPSLSWATTKYLSLLFRPAYELKSQRSERFSERAWEAWIRRSTNQTEVVPGPASSDAQFIPSPALTKFWIRGVQLRLKKAGARRPDGFVFSSTSLDAREAFGRLLTNVISVIGYNYQHGVEEVSEFGRRGHFDVSVTDLILNQIPILGEQATPFFELLYQELLAYLQVNSFEGDWGTLIKWETNIDLKTKPAVVEELSKDWKVAKVLE
jgi:hypothetical protein